MRIQRKQVVETVICVLMLLAVAYGILVYSGELDLAKEYLRNLNPLAIPLMLVFSTMMWGSAGGMWTLFLSLDNVCSYRTACEVQYEINFVDAFLPYINTFGFDYAHARLTKLGFSKDRAGQMVTFRYLISISTKWVEVALALAALQILGVTQVMPAFEVFVLRVLTVIILGGFVLGFVVLQRKITLPQQWLAHPVLGEMMQQAQAKLDQLTQIVQLMRQRKALSLDSFAYGMLYSFFEVAPFIAVALAIDQELILVPELIFAIIVAAGAAIFVGVIITPTPMGLIGFDAIMIVFLYSTGMNWAMSTIIVVLARLFTLVITAINGPRFWRAGMKEIKSED